MYLQATLQIVWAARGQTPLVQLHPGRESTHFYGALNLLNGHDIAMRSPIMNAETSALFLEKILLAYPDDPILLLWDRAPWHRAPKIKTILEANSRLEIIYFPPGAPDLNPQEQVWKATRRAISHNHSGKKLDKLANDFEDYLATTTFPCSLLDQYAYSHLCMMSK